jgi:transcriptional regulator with GAF, ATPase, and Fis domain
MPRNFKQLKNRLQAENSYLQEEISLNHKFEEILGQSQSLKTVLRQVEQVAPTDTTVLILGETGCLFHDRIIHF